MKLLLLEHDCKAESEAESEPQQERKLDYFNPSDDGSGTVGPGGITRMCGTWQYK
jgi:hypothetical protein